MLAHTDNSSFAGATFTRKKLRVLVDMFYSEHLESCLKMTDAKASRGKIKLSLAALAGSYYRSLMESDAAHLICASVRLQQRL